MKNNYKELVELYGELESDKVTEILSRTLENSNAGSEEINLSEKRIDIDIASQKLYQLHLPIKEWTLSQISLLSEHEYEFLNYILALPRKKQVEFYNYSQTVIKNFKPEDYDGELGRKLNSLFTRLSVFCMILMCIDYCVEVEMVLESLSRPIAESLISQIEGSICLGDNMTKSTPSDLKSAQNHRYYISKQPMELINEYTGEMRCKVCGNIHWASVRAHSKGSFYQGAWQCINGCKI
jgi:hypothetical protein